jgi:transcriptional regulator with XRE-family HTH domain
MNELRELRRDAHMTQQELADLLTVPVNTLPMWDSGSRRPPARVVVQVRDALAARARRRQLLPLAILALKLRVHVRTCNRRHARADWRRSSACGRSSAAGCVSRLAKPVSVSSQHYRCFNGQEICPAPLPTVPGDYDQRLREMRGRRGLTQDALARHMGLPAKQSSFNGNHGSEHRRRCCGNVFSN